MTTSLPFGRLSLLASFTPVYLEATSDVPFSWEIDTPLRQGGALFLLGLLDHRQGQSLSPELLL